MKPQSVLTVEIDEGVPTDQGDAFGSPADRFGNQVTGLLSRKKSLGGILVVDDDPAIRMLIRLILENSGYDAMEAEDGQEALELLSRGTTPMTIDLIITDLNMPKVDGFEAIASFQKEYPRIPVIVLTGIADPEVETSFRRQGVTDYLVKPVDARALMASVSDARKPRQ
jgi:two-component system chemotaxis response regulator CheY